MNSTRRRVRQQLQAACGQETAQVSWSQAPSGPNVAAAWCCHAAAATAPARSSDTREPLASIRTPWVLPEGLLFWHPDWGCCYLVQQGVRLPRPDATAEHKLRRLRVDRPHRSKSGPHAPAVASPRREQDAPPPEADQATGAGTARVELSGKAPVADGSVPETPAGIPELSLDLARRWKAHPQWQPSPAVLLCPVEPLTQQLHELAIHLAGAVAHLEQGQVLVVDLRPQTAAGLWRRGDAGVWNLLDPDSRLDWASLLRSTAYQRVWYLPRGRRRGSAVRREDCAPRWQQLLAEWQRRFAAVLMLGPAALAAGEDQVPPAPVQCCLLAALESSSRQGVLAGYARLRQLGGSPPLCFALPDPSAGFTLPRAA